MTAQIAIEAADFAALHTHAANRGEVLQVRFLHLCREVAGTPAGAAAEEDPAVLAALGLPATPATQPELAPGYELPPPPPPAGAHGILARAAKLNQTQM